MTDRSKDVSNALSEVRTVLSRAQTALDALIRDRDRKGEDIILRWDRTEAGGHWGAVPVHGEYEPDPEINSMIHEMEQVIVHLERWKGHRKSRGQRSREYFQARDT